MKDVLSIEMLTAPGCSGCQPMKALIREVVAEFDSERIQYREIDVVEEIDYAVQLGAVSAPAVAIDGELVFATPPSRTKLRDAIRKRLRG